MSNSVHRVPTLTSLDEYALPLARMVARASFLPNPATVAAMGGAVFPTFRSSAKRISPIEKDGRRVGMYDDNTTPRWALLWSHGIAGVSKQPSAGWTFAHVWPSGEDLDAYTHLANLAMMPECFASLTDKAGPVTHYLRWHAWAVYGWKPAAKPVPERPEGFDTMTWNYLPAIDDPKAFVHERLRLADCQRSRILKPLMGLAPA